MFSSFRVLNAFKEFEFLTCRLSALNFHVSSNLQDHIQSHTTYKDIVSVSLAKSFQREYFPFCKFDDRSVYFYGLQFLSEDA